MLWRVMAQGKGRREIAQARFQSRVLSDVRLLFAAPLLAGPGGGGGTLTAP